MLIRCLKIIAVLLVLIPFQVYGREVSFFTQKGERISSVLPDSWRPLTKTELAKYLEGRIPSATGTVLTGYVKPGAAGNASILFVFHALSGTPVAIDQRQKIFSWFKKNREFLKNMLPAPVSGMNLQNLEYIQDKQTILFETRVTMPDQELYGASGIVFMRAGYLDIIGYEIDGAREELSSFVEFIKNISLPPTLETRQRPDTPDTTPVWFRVSWQQAVGAGIILVIYGYVFLRREKSIV